MWVGSQRTIWSHLQWMLRGNRTAALLSIIGFGINGGFKNSEHMLLLELEEKIIT